MPWSENKNQFQYSISKLHESIRNLSGYEVITNIIKPSTHRPKIICCAKFIRYGERRG